MRQFSNKFLLLGLILIVAACTQQSRVMKITIEEQKVLQDIPSVSGIEMIGDEFWLLSDNSPWLHIIDEHLNLLRKLRITDDTTALENGVIPKARKHDFEAMFSFKRAENARIMLVGSGSTKNRMEAKGLHADGALTYTTHDLKSFFKLLMEKSGLLPEELNIEAATVANEDLFLFNRDKNKVIRLRLEDFLKFLTQEEDEIQMDIFTVQLPSINGIKAGFSGATTTQDGKQILFTASVENTSDWVQDGEVLGSMVGFISVDQLKDGLAPRCITLHDNGAPLLIKVESVAIVGEKNGGLYDCLLVTDSDGGESEILRLTVRNSAD